MFLHRVLTATRVTGANDPLHRKIQRGRFSVRDDLEISDECWARLHEHFGEPEIVELTFIIGFQTFASKFAKAFRLAPQGFSS